MSCKDKCCTDDKAKCDCAIIHHNQVENVRNNIFNDEKIIKLSNLYKVFSDQTRLNILLALEIETLCVCDIANVLNMTKSAVSHQLKILRENNLIKFDKKGKSCYYFLADEHVKKIIDIAVDHIEEL
ncbi:MAG: metalloregulator ArsR/SmtB family transcription factor [bacterium]